MLQTMLYPVLVYAGMLFLPGYLSLRCVRLPRTYSLCCAPIISTALVGILGEVYAALNVSATPLSIYLPLTLLPLVLFVLLSRRSDATGETSDTEISHAQISPWMIALFLLCGVSICNDLFVSELPSLNAVMQNYDVQHHLNATQAFVNAKRISSLRVSFYLTEADKAIVPFGVPSFYPAVWYGQCSLLVQATGIAVPEALNVSLATTLACAYPLGMCAFASTVFDDNPRAVGFCALTCVSFVMFPWCMLIFGPLYTNLVGFALMPCCMTLCMHAFLSWPGVRRFVLGWVLAFVSLIGQALLHPNTLFSAFVILVPFVTWLIYSLTQERKWSTMRSLGACVAFLAVCLAFWTICFKSPLFSSATSENWGRFAYSWQEVINILTQTYTLFFFGEFTAQILLGALVIFGWVRNAYNPKIRWLSVSYLATCFICFVSATTYNVALKKFIAGFWYTDAMRLSAMAIIVAALLAANGFDWLYTQVVQMLKAYNKRLHRPTHRNVVAIVLAGCFMIFNFMPGFNWPGAHSSITSDIVEYRMKGKEYDTMTVKTTFGDYKKRIRNAYNNNTPVDRHETTFLAQVKDLVGDDLVINNPYDGSTLGYGVYNIRMYYRKAHGFDAPSETAQSVAIRKGLYNLSEDAEVRQAVKDIDARWVIILDPTYSGNSFLHIRSKVNDNSYDGIALITPDTPGFTEVLASGACHLYRVE